MVYMQINDRDVSYQTLVTTVYGKCDEPVFEPVFFKFAQLVCVVKRTSEKEYLLD